MNKLVAELQALVAKVEAEAVHLEDAVKAHVAEAIAKVNALLHLGSKDATPNG